MERFRLFAVVGITSPPVELERLDSANSFTCSVSQPLPPQLLIFSQGDWPSVGDATLDVTLDSMKIGQITCEKRCLSWDTTSNSQISKVESLTLEVKPTGLPNQLLSSSKGKRSSDVTKTASKPAPVENSNSSSCDKSGTAEAKPKDENKSLLELGKPAASRSKPTDKKKRLSNPVDSEGSNTSQDENANVTVVDKSKPVSAGKKKRQSVADSLEKTGKDVNGSESSANETRDATSKTSVAEKPSHKKPSPLGEKKIRQTQLNFLEKKSLPAADLKKQALKEEKSKMTLDFDKVSSGAGTEAQKQYQTKEMMQTRLDELTTNDESDKSSMQVLNETTPQMPDMPSPLPRKPAKSKKRKSDETDNTPDGVTPRKRGTNTRMRAMTSEGTTPKSARGKTALGDAASQENIIVPAEDGEGCLKSEGKMARCIDLSGRAPRPSARWGHTMLLTQPRCAVLIGGQGERQQLSRDSVWTLHTETRKWQCQEIQSEGQKPENRMGHTATYDPTMRCIYIFGGSKNSRWFHDVHVYDLDENKWTLAKVNGKAPTRAYHTSTLYRHELWIFGGVYPRPDPNPDGCSNDIHIFSPVMQNWYSPLVTGEKPLPRSGHSATLINDQMVMFGGWDAPFCYNDLFVLDMTTLDWSKPNVRGTPPKPRSWHGSCALSERRILIHGGYDGDNALGDTFIFDLKTLSWHCLLISNAPCARAGHAAVSLPYNHENQKEDEVLIFGGGDNDGTFYQDLLSLSIPFHPLTQTF